LHEETNAHHACLRRTKPSHRDRLRPIGYQDIINGVERKPYPVIEGLRNIQRLMRIHNPALDEVKEDMIERLAPEPAGRERFYR
jgi:hypothetical protein